MIAMRKTAFYLSEAETVNTRNLETHHPLSANCSVSERLREELLGIERPNP